MVMSPTPGCFDPQCHHSTVVVGTPSCLSPICVPAKATWATVTACHQSLGLPQRTGWHYCIKNPSWPLGMLFFGGMVPCSPPDPWVSPWAPHTQQRSQARHCSARCSASPGGDLTFPWGFSFPRAKGFLPWALGGKATEDPAKPL